jgi:hypothetical protein
MAASDDKIAPNVRASDASARSAPTAGAAATLAASTGAEASNSPQKSKTGESSVRGMLDPQIGTVTIVGNIDRDSVLELLEHERRAFERCGNAAHFAVEIPVGADGRPLQVRVANGATGLDCVLQTASAWRFRAPASGEAIGR